MTSRRNYLLATATAALLALSAVALGGQGIVIPNTFVNGTTADADQVNANFAALATAALNRTAGTMTGVLTVQTITPGTDALYALGDGTHRFTTGFFSGTVTASTFSGSFTGSGSGLTGIAVQGKQTLWVPANAMTPTVTNGATGPSTTELTAGNPNITAISFVNGANRNAQFALALPKSWNGGTVTFQTFWTGTVAGAGTTIWGLQCVASADNATLDVAFGTAVEVTDTFLSTKASHVAPESGAITISGAAADTHMTCQIYRKGATDTRAQASLLLGVKLFFTTNAGNDQ